MSPSRCPFLALSGHLSRAQQCPLSGANRTWELERRGNNAGGLVAHRIRVLVSCEALRLGMGISYHLARLASIYRLHFAPCSWCLPISAEKSARWISNLCSGPVCCAHRRVLAQRRTATVALGCELRRWTGTQCDVRFWHKADIQLSPGNVRFWV
jgi:hypothetical protein